MKLRNWLPNEFFLEFVDSSINKLLDYNVIESNTTIPEHKLYFTCPINKKYIYNWCIIYNGKKKYYIAWNENPSKGWSFHKKLIKE